MSESEQGDTSRPNRRRRKPKQPNSREFHELLDRAIALSVTERVRLIRALSGLQGMVVNNPNAKAEIPPTQKKSRKRVKESLPVSDNPLKGTVLQANLASAQKAVRERKAELKVDKLSADDKAVVALKAAMGAYQAAHRAAKPFDEVNDTSKPAAERAKVKRQRETSKSPTRTPDDAVGASTTANEKTNSFSKTVATGVNNLLTGAKATVRRNSSSKTAGKKSGTNPPDSEVESDVDMQAL